MSELKNWSKCGLSCIAAYFAIGIVFALRDDFAIWYLPAWWFRLFFDWWNGGGFVSLVSIAFGYATVQTIAKGRLSLHILWKKGAILLVVPFLLAGGCARKVYQNAAAFGAFGSSTERDAVVIEKEQGEERYVTGSGLERDYAFRDTFTLLVWTSHLGARELTMPDGSVVMVDELLVSRKVFQEYAVGTRIKIVKLPWEDYPEWRLAPSARAAMIAYLIGGCFWLGVGVIGAAWGARIEGYLPTPHNKAPNR